MPDSSNFGFLHEGIRRYLWQARWESLRYAQEHAIVPILAGDRDVLIAAATASGKTEAAMLPALTASLNAPHPSLIVYISPLKALINDQFQRLELLCNDLQVSVWPWHGDIAASKKQQFRREPTGVVLITPESLEAMFCGRGTEVGALFQHVRYLVIDEFHAFIGSERGKQLQCLMHRMERLLSRRVPRIALSATLGELRGAARFLRGGDPDSVVLIEEPEGDTRLRIMIKGVQEPAVDRADEDTEPLVPQLIARDLFDRLRGSNNLVFPNQRRLVETYCHQLNMLCDEAGIPHEFFAHHGNLSADLRAFAEFTLKSGDRPATAVCTNTLELGIDIGAVKSVVQIGAPPSVSSLRQRLGRSGRRKGESPTLRGYAPENALQQSGSLETLLRLRTFQYAAMVSLLLERWYEPPRNDGIHGSTLVQQCLSIISQYGGIRAGALFDLIAGEGAPFSAVILVDDFKALLRHLASLELIEQATDGTLLLGKQGERAVSRFEFFASFQTDEEYRLESRGRSLGTLPVDQILAIGQRLLFAGRTWVIGHIDSEQRVISLEPASGGAPPLFLGSERTLHTRVRGRMRSLYESDDELPYLDEVAQRFIVEGRAAYHRFSLASRSLFYWSGEWHLCTWLGHCGNEAISARLRRFGLDAGLGPLGCRIVNAEFDDTKLAARLREIATAPTPTTEALLKDAKNLDREKWDHALPHGLRERNHASLFLDCEEAENWLRKQESFLTG